MHPRRFAGTMAGGTLLLYGLLSLSGTSVVPDVRKVDPRLLYSDAAASPSGEAVPFGAPSRATALVPVFLRTGSDDPALLERIRNVGGEAARISPRIHTARLPVDALRYVSNWSSVDYIEAGRRVRPLLDRSRPAVSADDVQAGAGLPGGVGYTGLGTLVGIVDTGMDGAHPDFYAGTPPVSRVLHTFTFSSRYSAMDDTDGHGTHAAGIAAGNGRGSGGLYTGMAPDAGIMVGRAGVSEFYDTDVVKGVADLFGYAEGLASPKPAAINLSLGLIDGPHDGTSGFESSINSLASGGAGSRRLVSVAAGNEQDRGEHFQANLPAFGTATASLTILPHSFAGAIVDLWADGEDRFAVTAVRGSESVAAASGSSASTPSGTINISNRVDAPSNHATHVQVFFTPPSGSAIPASIRLDRVRNGGSGKVDAYIDYLGGNFTGSGVSSTGTTIEPANGENVIAVGSFQTKTSGGGAGSLGISTFSSTGPTRDGRTKPDLAAPGEVIYSARSSQASFFPIEIVSGNDNYAILRGTSMAAPHVAGIAALVWESNPALTGAQMRERLRRTADPEGASPNTTWGYGKTNALRAVRESVAAITSPVAAVPGAPVSLSSANSSAAFPGNSLSYAWSLAGMPAGSAASLAAVTQTASFTPDIPGDYLVRLEVTQATPAGTPHGVATAAIHVNHLPVADFTVPASENSGRPVVFRSSASDADNQPLTRRWLLVSRPGASRASITGSGVDNAVFTPDVPGTYEIGLRADDGLDNSALVVHAYTTLDAPSFPSAPSSSSGGCLSIARSGGGPPDVASLVSLGVLLLPAGALGVRRVFLRRSRPATFRHPAC